MALIDKSKFPLVQIVGQSVALSPVGNEFTGLCPFHEEKTPSFRVNDKRFKCFGCGEGGDVIAWVMKTQGKTFSQAVDALNKLNLQDYQPPKYYHAEPKKQRVNFEEYTTAHGQVCAAAHAELLRSFTLGSPFAPAHYLKSRGFDVQDAMRFSLGYCDTRFHGTDVEILLRNNLARVDQSGSPYPIFSRRLLMPFRNAEGAVIGFDARDMTGSAKSKYINTTNSSCFSKGAALYGLWEALPGIRKKQWALIVEGPTDVIRLHKVGYTHAVACCGTSLTREQIALLPCQRYVVMMDGDRPGLDAVVRLATKLQGLSITFALLTDGKDPDTHFTPSDKPKSALLLSNATQLINIDYFHQKRFIMTPNNPYACERLQMRLKPWIDRNIQDGYSHFNVIPWVISAYPQYAEELRHTIAQMEISDYSDASIKSFLSAWAKPCRDVRTAFEAKKPGGVRTLADKLKEQREGWRT